MTDEEHIEKGKGLVFSDVGTDSDDDSLEDEFSSDFEEDDGIDYGGINDEDNRNYSVIDEN